MGELIERYFTNSKLVVIDENIDTRSAAGVLVLNVLISVSQWERQAIGERTSAALQELKACGAKLGGAPFGYTKHGNDAVINHTEMRVVTLIKSLREAGDTLQAVCDKLNGQGLPTRSGKDWTPKVVRSIAKRDYDALAA
jgi:DNA invertase Pin-like site-specific DNA recombinase